MGLQQQLQAGPAVAREMFPAREQRSTKPEDRREFINPSFAGFTLFPD